MLSTDVTIEQLQRQFPCPVPSPNTVVNGYSVGGALIMWLMGSADPRFVREIFRFPDSEELSFHLTIANSTLSKSEARMRAFYIIKAEMKYNYTFAWKRLEAALKAKGTAFKAYQ